MTRQHHPGARPMSATEAVFTVTHPIPEIGAEPGDRLVVRPDHTTQPYALVRPLSKEGARWALSDRCRLLFTDPPGTSRHELSDALGAVPALRVL